MKFPVTCNLQFVEKILHHRRERKKGFTERGTDLHNIINGKPLELESWNVEKMFTTHHVSCVMFYVSHVTCHVSSVLVHLSHVMFFFNKTKKWQIGGASRWRVCYQPLLVCLNVCLVVSCLADLGEARGCSKNTVVDSWLFQWPFSSAVFTAPLSPNCFRGWFHT